MSLQLVNGDKVTHFQAPWPDALNPDNRTCMDTVYSVAWRIFSIIIFPIVLIEITQWALRRAIFKYGLPAITPASIEEINRLGREKLEKWGGEQLNIRTPDGVMLDAALIPGKSKKAVIYLNGLSSNWQLMKSTPVPQDFDGYVLYLNAHGFGNSEIGDPTEKTLSLGPFSAFKLLEEKYDIKADQCVFMGHSMGAAIATLGAQRVHEQYPDKEIKLINYSSYNTLAYAAKKAIQRNVKPWLLAVIIAKIVSVLIVFLQINYNIIKAIKGLPKVCIVSNEADQVIPRVAQIGESIKELGKEVIHFEMDPYVPCQEHTRYLAHAHSRTWTQREEEEFNNLFHTLYEPAV